MGAIQGSVNSMLGTTAVAATALKKISTDTKIKKEADIKAGEEAATKLEALQLAGKGLSEKEIAAYQSYSAIEGDLAGKGNEAQYDLGRTNEQGEKVLTSYSEIKAELANSQSYQQALIKARLDKQFQARLAAANVSALTGGNK